MSRKNSLIKKYLMNIGISFGSSLDVIEDLITHEKGPDFSANYMKEIRNAGNASDDHFYEIKNSDYTASLILTMSFDHDIYLKAGQWIERNNDYFGETILDVGCDTGIMTCFLAKLFPNSKITAIDTCSSSIAIARELGQHLGINNVEFICTKVEDLKDLQFDTVFTMRTVHENLEGLDNTDSPRNPQFKSFKDQCYLYRLASKDYATTLAALSAHYVVSIERANMGISYWAWTANLANNGMKMEQSRYSDLECQELRDYSHFQACVFTRSPEIVKDDNLKFCMSHISNEYWSLVYMIESEAESLIRGCYLIDSDNKRRGKFSLWNTHNGKVLCVQQNSDGGSANYIPRYAVDAQINLLINHHKKCGLKIEDFEYVDGHENVIRK